MPNPKEDILRIFWKQISILGSTMGSNREFAEMLAWVTRNGIRPVLDQVFPMSRIQEAETH